MMWLMSDHMASFALWHAVAAAYRRLLTQRPSPVHRMDIERNQRTFKCGVHSRVMEPPRKIARQMMSMVSYHTIIRPEKEENER